MSLQPGPDDPTADSSLTPDAVPGAAGPDHGPGTVPAEPAWTPPPPPPPGGYGPPPPAQPAGGYGAPPPMPDAAPPPPAAPAGGYGAPPPAWVSAPAPGPGYGQAGWGANPPPVGPPPAPGYGAYPPGYPAAPQTDSKAIIGLVLALVSWVLCPVILAIAALVVAGQSNGEIAASGGRLEGRGLNTATKWVAWINIVVSVLVLVAMLFFFGWLASQPDLINEITNDPSVRF